MASTLPTCNEDDIALCGSDIVALQKKKLIDTIILKSRDFDYSSNWACEALLDNEILFALDLHTHRAQRVNGAGPHELALPREWVA